MGTVRTLVVAAGLLAWSGVAPASTPAPADSSPTEAAARLRREHVDGARAAKLPPSAGLDALVAALGDPWTRRYDAAATAVLIAEVSGGAHVGVGLPELLSLDIDPQSRLPMVVTPLPDSPAARAGLGPRDLVVAIDGQTTHDLPWSEVMRRLRGPAGSAVRLSVRRDGKSREVSLTRAALPAQTAGVRAATSRAAGAPVLHLAVARFGAGTAEAARAALVATPVLPVVLDLRNNPGGDVEAAQALAGLFLGDAPMAAIRSARAVTPLRAKGPALPARPLAVLVNEGSASAAELVATALASVARTPVVGAPTMRKCLLHMLITLSDGGALLYTSGRLQSLGGASLCDQGAPLTKDARWSDAPPPLLPVPASGSDAPFRLAAQLLTAPPARHHDD